MGASTMEKIRVVLFAFALGFAGCSAKFLAHDKEDQLKHIDEFDNKVKIVIPEETPAAPAADVKSPEASAKPAPIGAKVSKVTKKTAKEKVAKGKKVTPGKPSRRQPELESDIGFEGRRPLKDPFRVGEKVIHAVDYYKVSAGTMVLEVKPFAQVNGNKSYHFEMTAKTSNWYSGIYKVEDRATILMDFDTLVPSVFTLHVKETSQLKEARMLFEGNKATYWEKKVTEKSGVEEKKQNWDIEDYTQSLYSAVFYMRFFNWEVGKEIAFRVADDNENMIFKGQAIRKEKISTKAGEFNAIVIRPQVELKGKFKQAGDIFMWLSDDDRKYILRIEAKIKIGSLVSEVIELHPGNP